MTEPTVDQQEIISQFVAITGADRHTALQVLSDAEWNLESGVTAFYNPEDESEDSRRPSDEQQSSEPQPIPTTSSMPPPPVQPPKKKFATLGDINSSSGASGSHAGHGHSGDDSDDADENPNLYAGGEKSGLAVANPDDLKKKIVERAMKNVARPGGDEPRQPPSHFKGTARTLGGDDTPSEVIEDPTAQKAPSREQVERRLHFWTDGFSVDDGPLLRLDDPNNAEILDQIRQGRAPLSILNVQRGQEVDVKIEQHSENYVKPKAKYKPFSGGGQRLGSPTPGMTTTDSSASKETPKAAIPATTSSSSSTSTQPSTPTGPSINESETVITLQVRLGDGTRLPARFNATHTIGDVYNFVNSASAASRTTNWVLMTTFPSTELNDKAKKLGELTETKRGGTVIQRWK